ncbi:hypothetical protein [Nesterenkonia pannonica]|uniref:hypothetical protein n=1 Tax=Nesterenkonia pannonica TaxID=1548602 RepID=UPI0021648DD4|nr:hypothetical protein [Nesterenkonia pannonica]
MPRPQPKTAGLRLSAAAAMIALVGVSCGAPEEEPAEEPVEEPDSTDEADPGQDLDEDAPDAETEETQEEDTGDEEPEDEPVLGQAGVSAYHPLAVEVGSRSSPMAATPSTPPSRWLLPWAPWSRLTSGIGGEGR